MKLEKLNVVELQVFEANEIVGGGGWRDIIIGVITLSEVQTIINLCQHRKSNELISFSVFFVGILCF